MMNKKRSRGIGRTKYLIFIPLAGCLMLFSNIDAVARITGELTDTMAAEMLPQVKTIQVSAQVVGEMHKPLVGVNVVVGGTTTGTITDQNGTFALNASEDAIIELSGLGLRKREIAVKDIKENMKIQLLPEIGEGAVFTVVDVMPLFPGGQDALLKYLAESVQYPVEAQNKGISGRVSCSFVINADGSIRDVEVIRGVDALLDAEAVRVIKAMPNWTPGRQRGKDVAVKYTVPVSFRLERVGTGKQATSAQTKGVDTSGRIFSVVEEMPEYPDGQGALMSYLAHSIKYPIEAQKNGIEGRVSCSFVVETDGSFSGIEVIRSVDPLLDAESVRVLSLMPKWKPGKQRGVAVRVQYTVPVTFRLQ